jgi:glycosyltransferase involved in cell wall biosynthesis
MIENPLVTICTLTYNQESFIKQTVESLLMQETDFEFEVIISDDGSTDSTVEIIKDLITSHEKGYRIKLLAHENMGVLPNYIYTFKQCRGKYVAFCEGDDYWTDPKKLSIQVEFLEKNPDYSICFHQVNKIFEDDVVGKAPTEEEENTFVLKDLAKSPLMYTPSVMMRAEHMNLPKWYEEAPLFDYPLQMMVAKKGKIKYLPLNMANYRVGTGIWTTGKGSGQMKKLEKLIYLLQREFSDNDEIYSILSQRKDEYTHIISQHEFYLSLYNQTADLSKISFVTTIKLLFAKLKSKIS